MENDLLVPKLTFGYKPDVKSALHYYEEHAVMYPCGHSVVIYNTENREQQFINCTDQVNMQGITAIQLSPSKRYLAIAEQCDKSVVVIYDTTNPKRRKVLSSPDVLISRYECIAFSPDGKTCLTQGGGPDWTLVAWTWEKNKVIATVKTIGLQGTMIHQVDFCPVEPSIVCVSGIGVLKIYKFSDGQFRQQPLQLKRDIGNVTCHSWIGGDKLIACTEQGELWYLENLEFKCVLGVDTHPVYSIQEYSKGFACGGSDGALLLFEKSDDPREYFRSNKIFHVADTTAKMVQIAISPSEDTIVCALDSKQLYTLNLSNTDILKEDAMNFEPLCTSFHGIGLGGSSITGLDDCIRKPIIATCGMDKSVRIWNYLEKTADLIKFYDEEPHSIAVHPSGLQVLVGFTDKLRLMNLLMDDIQLAKEYSIKRCSEVRFSNGGQYFAAASGNSVVIYSTYTNMLVGVLRGHSNLITTIEWLPGDKRLVTGGSDGSVFTWTLRDGIKESEGYSNPKSFVSSICSTADSASVYVSDSDCFLKEIDLATGLVRNETESAVPLGALALSLSQQTLYCGTVRKGHPSTIRAYKLPFISGGPPETYEIQAHDGPVSRLRLSFDGQYLFSCGEDGSLAIIETKEHNVRGVTKVRDRDLSLSFAEEILVTKSDIEQKTKRMQELMSQVEELTLHNDYQLRLKDLNYKEKLKEVSEKFSAELEQDRQRFTDLQAEKRDMELEYDEKLEAFASKKKDEIDELETNYKSKIESEKERHLILTRETDERAVKRKEDNQMLVESHTQFLAEMTSDYDNKVTDEQAFQAKLIREKEEAFLEFEESKNFVENDADGEISELKAKYDSQLSAEREATLRLKGENGIMKKKYSALQKDIEDQREEIRSLLDKEQELVSNIKGFEKDIHGHKKEIREREETIQDKEKRIYDLKKKNQELEKFKFVLDYKIKELKRQIEPRENEIADMRQQIEEMDQELEQYHRSNEALDLMIGELRLKMEGMQKELVELKDEQIKEENLVRQFHLDLRECMRHLQDNKKLKAALIKIYKVYVQDQFLTNNRPDVNIQQENNRQREYLEKSVESLKRKIAKDMETHKNETSRLMRENAALTKESNLLRREHHSVEQDEKQLLAEDNITPEARALLAEEEAAATKVRENAKEIQSLEAKLDHLQKALVGSYNESNLNEQLRPAYPAE